jgi:putative spermidine/putrescine transport system ATP-binding protein
MRHKSGHAASLHAEGTGAARFGALRLEGITRRFGNNTVLSGLDLEIQQGEFLALLGPSGCGKTTALNCIAGLLPLTAGRVWLGERRIDLLPPEQRGFGMVFQNYALFPHLTVGENVDFGLRMHGIRGSQAEELVRAALEMVRLADRAADRPAQLSGGQQQRVAIARALAFQPEIILMDEPLSNLDAKLRLEMRTEVRRLHQKMGLTTVYVTHDQEEALSLADRIVVLESGLVRQMGSPEDVYTHPVSPYVAGFMGYRNVFDLDVVSANGSRVRLAEPGLELTGVGDAPSGRATVAMRPEDLSPDGAGTNSIEVEVVVIEYRGRELHAEGTTSGGRQLHFVSERRLAPGDRVTLRIVPERVLVFSAPVGDPAAADAPHPTMGATA